MLFALFVPNIASAEIITTTYDFKGSIDAGNTTVTMSGNTDATYTNCEYFSTIGNVNGASRFAAQGTWILTEAHKMGLYSNNGGGRRFLVSNLYKGDIVTFDVVDVYGNAQTISLESTNATANGNTFTMSDKGTLCVTLTRYWNIKTITVQHDDVAVWGYDPAIETYDMYWNTDGIASNNLKPAGFPLDYDDYEAQYLTNLSSGTALNDRIAISQVEYNGYYTPWQIDHGFKSLYNWHNISITNLVEGDRVVITWIGSAKFSSKAENTAYNGCAAFKDNGNDGDFTEGVDTEISLGMSLEAKTTNWDNNAQANIYTSYPYVITEDGHLDIALSADSRIVKVVIYGDHQAQMIDRDNDHGTTTSYFDTTGQLEAKQHIVPGGLNVYVGNTDNTQHAEVVSSDQGPVSFVYDQDHFKMARNATWGSVDANELPVTGTYYKFVPEVTGKMWVKFKAVSVKYRNYGLKGNNENIDGNGTPNEYTAAVNCPYYLKVLDGNTFQSVENAHYYSNGANGYFGSPNGNPGNGQNDGITVERGKTYYLYGWWQDGTNSGSLDQYACGVAELIEVTFMPNQYVEPLAKWVESGTTSDSDLADVKGYNTVRVKKTSDNIASCTPYIEGGKLKIKDITFVDENKGGGTILIKIGDPNIDADPVFAYTIAYDAGYNPSQVGQDINGETITRSEGHTWDFSEKPLKGLKWSNKNAQADEAVFGPYFNNFATADKDANGVPTNGVNSNCFLYEEMNKTNPDGSKHSDWTFNYRVKKNNSFMDPRFLNNYDMEGDNADMMWDTEGLIINAGSTQSCIFDEFMLTSDRVIDHTNKTQDDPDRYIGFLEGGEFIIPCLKKGDRVIVYMASGNGSGNQAMQFNITNALDAVHNPIDADDFYYIGGSQWNVPNGHNDPYYRGCYHFFAAADGDMKFTMAGGSMCKLYSIKIYRGARECTNGVQENSGGYTLLAVKDQSGTVTSTETKSWTLHFRGKGEQVADGTGALGQANEVIASSGNITNTELGVLTGGTSNARIGITYTNEGEIGVLRARIKCMEYNQKYVTDFADRNFTLALHETKTYPYTWDFTDINGFSSEEIEGEYNEYNEITDLTSEDTWFEPLGRELSMWDENGAMVLRTPEEYTNQNMIFENSKGINGNQLYANGNVLPETQGLWWYMDSNDPTYNGSMQITADGLKLANTKKTVDGSNTMGWWNYKMVVPAVPADGVVYLRMTRDDSVADSDYSQKQGENPIYFLQTKFHFGVASATNPKTELTTDNGQAPEYNSVVNSGNYSFYNIEGTDDWIVAVKNTTGAAEDLTFTLNGWILKKMSISSTDDFKSLDSNGWATESREHVVDPSLTAFLTGEDIETCFVEEVSYGKIGKGGQVKLTRAILEDGEQGQVVRATADDGEAGACILHNTAGEPVKILDNGFHLFVPDMHDFEGGDFTNNDATGVKTVSTTETSILKAQLTKGTISATDGNYTNYILSNKKYAHDGDTGEESVEAFYRVSPTKPAKSNGHNAYLQLLTSEITGKAEANAFEIVFELDKDADGINEVNDTKAATVDGIYTIDGQKLEGMPTNSGLYIVNGQ